MQDYPGNARTHDNFLVVVYIELRTLVGKFHGVYFAGAFVISPCEGDPLWSHNYVLAGKAEVSML